MSRPSKRLWCVAPVEKWPVHPAHTADPIYIAVRVIERETGEMIADVHIRHGRSMALRTAREVVAAHNAEIKAAIAKTTATLKGKKNEQNENRSSPIGGDDIPFF